MTELLELRVPRPSEPYDPEAVDGISWEVFERLSDAELDDPSCVRLMTPAQRCVFAFNYMRQEVTSAGFEGYLYDSSGDYLDDAIAAADIAGTPWKSLLVEIKALFGSPFPHEAGRRQDIIDAMKSANENVFQAYDERFRQAEKDHNPDAHLDAFVLAKPDEFFAVEEDEDDTEGDPSA